VNDYLHRPRSASDVDVSKPQCDVLRTIRGLATYDRDCLTGDPGCDISTALQSGGMA